MFSTLDTELSGFTNKMSLLKVSLADLTNAFNAGTSSGFSGFVGGLKSVKNALSSTITQTDIANIEAYNAQIDACVTPQTAWYRTMQNSSKAAKDLVESANGGKVSMEGLTAATKSSKIAMVGMRVATIALNAAISTGIAFAIQWLISLLDSFVHSAKNASEAADEVAAKSKEETQSAVEEASQLDTLIAKYKELAAKDTTDVSTRSEIASVQEQIVDLVGSQASNLDLVNGKLDEQLEKLYEISNIDAKDVIEKANSAFYDAVDAANAAIGEGSQFWVDGYEYLGDVTSEERDALGEYMNFFTTQGALIGESYGLNFTSGSTTIEGQLTDIDVSTAQAKIDALEEMMSRLETLEGHSDSELYTGLSKAKTYYEEYVQSIKDSGDELISAMIESSSTDAELQKISVEDAESYEQYRQALIDKLSESDELKGKIEDGYISIDSIIGDEDTSALLSITDYVDNYMATLDTFSDGYDDWISQQNAQADKTVDIYTQATAAITETAEQAAESATNLISGITAAQEAINGQQTGMSISIEDFNSDELKDYQSALEYTNGTMQLNAEKVREIAEAKAEEQVEINNTNKALEQAKYLENAKQIAEYRQKLEDANYAEGETAESVQSSIDALLSENETIAATCDQYDLLSASIQEAVGSYQNWLNAQSASDYGDMADDTVDAIQRIRDTFDEDSDIYGQVGSKKFEAAVEFAVPDSVDKDDVDAIESWKDDFAQYLNFDDDGNVDSLNIDQFLSNAVEQGLMNYDDENGFTIAGQKSMEDFAEGLNMSSGMVQAFFDELQLYGGEFDWSDEATKTFRDMAVEANEAAEALRNIKGNENLKIALDVSEFEDASKACETLDATIAEMNSVKAKPDVDASEVEYANSVIEYCVAQKQLLSAPAVMSVDTSNVTGDIGTALSLLKEFQEAQNDLEVKTAIGADTSEAQAKVDSLTTEIQNLSPEIKASVGLDDTSSTTAIQTFIDGLSAEAIVKLGVDASLVEGYQSSEHPSDGTVTWDNDVTAVAQWIAQSHVADGTVNWDNNTANVKTHFYASGTINWTGSGGTDKVNGTAHASGTAQASGNWGTATGGETLVGELGRELVVDTRTGQWYTVGDNGAEFRDIPAGAIVFNHRQTEDLLANGYVAGRAHALVNGTAMVTGGIKRPRTGGGSSSTSSSGSSSGSSSSNSSSSSSSGSSSSSSSSSSDEEDSTEIVDWIEIAIDRIERAIDNLSTIASSAFRTLSERLGATNDEISQMNYELSLQQSAYDRYIQEANSVGLSSDLAAKVQDGTIDITEYDDDVAEQISDYQKWYEKALDCKDAILELSESIAELYQDKFDTVAEDYENQLSLLEHLTNTYNNGIDDIEERGYLATTKYYEALQNVEQKNIDVRKQELNDLITKMSEGINSGSIKEGSEAWYEMQQEINDIKEAIQESETAMIEFSNSIREVKWEHFDYLQEQISNITEEADFLIDLMENSDLYTDNGQLTDTGMATMGLHGQNYNVYMAQADKYAEELLELNKELAEDPYNTKLLERREELLESQRDAILAAEDEKQAIVDMVEEGINLELDALQDLIDKYEDSLDSAKDLYDYQKKVKEQTEEISSLQKQLSAYSGDTSEETRATVQKLQVDLSDAMEDLQETEYEQYISETKKLLDNLYTEYEMILNERLDNIDALISDMIDTINANSSSISDTLLAQADKVGYTISDSIKDIWSNEGGAFTIITKYGESFLTQLTTVNDVISKIAYKIGAMVAESDKTAQTTVDKTTSTTPTDTSKKPTSTTTPTTDTTKKTTFNDDIKRGVAAAIWIYGSKSGWGNNPQRKNRLTEKFGSSNASAVQSYINAHSSNGDLYKYWVSTGKSKLSQYYYSAFKKGGLADYTGMAWMDGTPSEPEMVLNSEDTANFIALKDAMKSVADGNSPLAELFGGSSSSGILEQLAKIDSPLSGQSTSVGDITYQVTIPIDHVQDYEDFMNQMRKDGKFEKMIQSMTVDRLVGGSKLAKNRYQW